MPAVTIDGRTVEVEAGTNLIEAGHRVGVEIPHYCYHPRLSVVGQCRMCLVKIEGMPKLQTACTTQVMKDGMVVEVDHPEVKEAQTGIMEFLLINHPLDCPICDQAGECGLQNYSFEHGQAFSRFQYEDKRTYPGRERIPLGPSVVLNMNRCIQCTRCIRFTEEISQTGELGFYQRGSRAEIGVFPGKVLDNDLSTCVVDVCPVGALTSTRFRFAERVWYLDKKPSVCDGCDVGCNITVEHRRGLIKRLKPRFNEWVNDYWMCDYGRGTYERWQSAERLATPRIRGTVGTSELVPASWSDALARILTVIQGTPDPDANAFLASAHVTTEEAFLLARTAQVMGSSHRYVCVESGPVRTIPTTHGDVTGSDAAPNRRGATLAGLRHLDADELVSVLGIDSDEAGGLNLLFVLDADLGGREADPAFVEALQRVDVLVVAAWAEGPLTELADVVLPLATIAEKDGTVINVQNRLQRLHTAFPAPGQSRSGVGILVDLLLAMDIGWKARGVAQVFDLMAAELDQLDGLSLDTLPSDGVLLDGSVPGGPAGRDRETSEEE